MHKVFDFFNNFFNLLLLKPARYLFPNSDCNNGLIEFFKAGMLLMFVLAISYWLSKVLIKSSFFIRDSLLYKGVELSIILSHFGYPWLDW